MYQILEKQCGRRIFADPEEATSKSGSVKEISEMGAFAVSKLVVIEQSEGSQKCVKEYYKAKHEAGGKEAATECRKLTPTCTEHML